MMSHRPSKTSSPLRVYMVGAHATGKTTLARWVRDHYRVPMIAEVARGVLAESPSSCEQKKPTAFIAGVPPGPV